MIPKIIWIYWHQGAENAPEVVKKCVLSWKILNPKYEVRLLSDADLYGFIDLSHPVYAKTIKKSIAAYSDAIRINLLHQYGGIWVDSTLLCLQPLNQWLEKMEFDLFAFANPGPDRMISSWFLAASTDSYIAQEWKKAADQYWLRWKWKRPYYWFHHLFADLYQSDDKYRKIWDHVEKVSSHGPHHLTPFREKFFQEATEKRVRELREKNLTVLKLTYKCLQDGYPKGSMIDFVLHDT